MSTAFHIFSLLAFAGLIIYALKLKRQIGTFSLMLSSLQNRYLDPKSRKIRVDFPGTAIQRLSDGLGIPVDGVANLKALPPVKIDYGAFLSLLSYASIESIDIKLAENLGDAETKPGKISIMLGFNKNLPKDCQDSLAKMISKTLPFSHDRVEWKIIYT